MSTSRQLNHTTTHAYPQLPGLSSGFQALLRDMLSPSARDRPPAADVVRRAQALLGSALVAAASSSSSSSLASNPTTIAAAAAAVAAGAAHHHHHHHHHPKGATAVGAPAGALGAGAGGRKAAESCSLPHCQAQQKRIRDLEEMVLSLTGLKG
jgi:peptidoglycan/LPS O-acetylase OafA/YrhL